MDIKDFYEKNFERQVRLIRHCLKFNKHLADDVVQDAYANAIDKLDQYDETKASFNTWFNKIMFNKLKDIQSGVVTVPLNDNIPEDVIPYELVIVSKELPEVKNIEHRRTIKLFYLLGYTSKEISELTGNSVSNITTICNRFKSKLKDKYNVSI